MQSYEFVRTTARHGHVRDGLDMQLINRLGLGLEHVHVRDGLTDSLSVSVSQSSDGESRERVYWEDVS